MRVQRITLKALDDVAKPARKGLWCLKQLLPMTYWTTFTSDGTRRVTIWKMWLGRCFGAREWTVME